MPENKRFKKIIIDDIPIMLGARGEIICIPKEQEVFSAAVVGSSGSGKSLIMNRLSASIYYQWGANVAIMNDLSEETYNWSEPMKNKEFNEFNDYWLNQPPTASPLYYVFPNTKGLKFPMDVSNKNAMKIVIPFEEAMENIGFYLSGVCPEFELGKSDMYVNEIKDELSECTTPSEIKEVLEEQLPGADGKSFKAMRVKIKTAFSSLFKENILDITNPECYSYLKIREQGEKDFISNPLSVLMKGKFIPSFITSELVEKKYKSEVFAYYINSIFKNHLKDFPGEKTFLFFDELRKVCEKDDEPASKAIGDVSARGRINQVGLVFATQFYDKIPNCVKGAKLNYCFAFSHHSSKILNEIGSDFDLDTKTKQKIKHLKKFEVMAMTNNKFVCYHEGERYETNKPIIGSIFFPLADHLYRK